MSDNSGNIFDSGLEMARRVVLGYKGIAGSGNAITDISKIGMFQPITLISSHLKVLPNLDDILHGLLDITASHYATGIGILATKTVDPRILKILDSVHPDRDLRTVTTALAIENNGLTVKHQFDKDKTINTMKYLALEGLEFGLRGDKLIGTTLTGESNFGTTYDSITGLAVENNKPNVNANGAATVKMDSFEQSETTVGKVIEVSFRVGADKDSVVSLPIVVKLDNIFMPSEVLANVMTMNEEAITFTSRTADLFAGRISFIKDYLLCSDLIKKQKSNLMKDPTRTYADMLNRVNNSRFYSLLSRNPSLASISGVFVISEEENNQIKMKLGGDLKNKKTRQIVFDNSSVMMIAVVDTTYEQVDIFIRDMDNYSTISFSRFKKQGKGGNNDQLAEIFRSMSVGRVPTF